VHVGQVQVQEEQVDRRAVQRAARLRAGVGLADGGEAGDSVDVHDMGVGGDRIVLHDQDTDGLLLGRRHTSPPETGLPWTAR
jgi:hypothetical protein